MALALLIAGMALAAAGYASARRVDPERWTAEARETRPKFSYFPFGGGPRVCIGEQFAWMEGILLLASLSFLGLGSPDPASELGSMTARGLTYLFTNWNVAVYPAAAVLILVFVANFAGDAIRDLVDS